MKMLMVAVTIGLMLLNTSYADDANEVRDAGVIKLCKSIEDAAMLTMESRQSGQSIEESIKFSSSIENNVVKKMIRHVIFMAYEYPIYPSESEKQSASLKFSKMNYKECLKSLLLNP